MIRKTIEISSGPARLSIERRQLVIDRPDLPKATLPCEDLGVVIIDNQAVSYTHAVFIELLEAGAAVVLCGRDHHPAGIVLPIDGHTTQTERHRMQASMAQPFRKRAWAEIVGAKIRQQSISLTNRIGRDEGLKPLSGRVRSGDPDNLEAQAAQRYWRAFFGGEFRRDRDGPPPNSFLNYGYMVLRATMARSIVSSGLLPTLGLHHHNRYNPFCLADDLMEPYRPFVDIKVGELVDAGATEIDKASKAVLLSVLNETILVAGRKSPVLLAMQVTASSMAKSLETATVDLALPEGAFVRQADLDLAASDDGEAT